MNIIKESVISSRFLPKRKDIGTFFIEIVIPSGYTYFEWDNLVYKASFDANNMPRFNPTGKFFDKL